MKEKRCKKCKKILPDTYKKKYCEACMNKNAKLAKGGALGALGFIIGIIFLRKK